MEMKTPLGDENLELGQYFLAYRYCSPLMISGRDVRYIAAERCVYFRVILPNGPTGYTMASIPWEISTLGNLLEYLIHTKDCTLKNPVKQSEPSDTVSVIADRPDITARTKGSERESAVMKDNAAAGISEAIRKEVKLGRFSNSTPQKERKEEKAVKTRSADQLRQGEATTPPDVKEHKNGWLKQ